jgi:phosphohistidine swiveling domain-containing protein
MTHFFGDPMRLEDVMAELREVLENDPQATLDSINRNRDKRLAALDKILKDLDNPELDLLAKKAREYLFLETLKLNAIDQADYLIHNLLNEIAKRMGLNFQQLIFVSHKEILDFLESGDKPDVEEINERMKAYAILNIAGSVKIYSGKGLEEYLKKERVDYGNVSELKGTVANKGFLKSKVTIVNDSRDIKKIEQGDVLISAMVIPALTAAVRKAAAIVTDEGGLTSHATIVAREFNIPCIVGTEIATKVLKNGDLVEVDAINGVIRKL